MITHVLRTWVIALLSLMGGILCVGVSAAPSMDDLKDAIAAPNRSETFKSRDSARHPLEELTFARLKPNQTVVEIWPSGGYWSEILGPYLSHAGQYRLILSPSTKETDAAQIQRWQDKLAHLGVSANHVSFGFLGQTRFELGADNSADIVLTFRNIHNWMEKDYANPALSAMYKTLKPGGYLLVEEHRGRNDRPQDPHAEDGYVRSDVMIQMAQLAGFKLIDQSELLANPKDTKDYPEGVWTLPPTLALKDKDRDRYLAIGEADNFLMLFQKPN